MLARDLKLGEYGLIINSDCGHNGCIVKVIISNNRVDGLLHKCEVLTAINRTDTTWGHFKKTTIQVEKLKNVKITYDGCPETKSEYPKMMIVSDFETITSDKSFKRLVITKYNSHFIGVTENNSYDFTTWKFAKDIETEELIHLTLEDISNGKGVGVNPELIRIKK